MPLLTPEEIPIIYKKHIDDFTLLEATVKSLLSNLISAKGHKIHLITSRVKTLESTTEKITRKNKYSSLEDMTDIIGIRIITFFEKQVDEIAEIIEREFDIDEENSIDKRKSIDPEKFGYLSLHYVASINHSRMSMPEYQHLTKRKFEIQVRSILQHAWAEIEHSIGYKSRDDVPREIRRTFSQVASLLEVSDKNFNDVGKQILEYKEKVRREINIDANGIKLDKVSLDELKNNSSFQELEDRIANEFRFTVVENAGNINTHLINEAGFKSIGELLGYLARNFDKIKEYHRIYDDPSNSATYFKPRGFTIATMCYLKLDEQNKLEKYFHESPLPKKYGKLALLNRQRIVEKIKSLK
ncbi:hypothetical protein CBQ26_13395 [Deinococcus indicus]|uniref:RelA/SpoT domain-containing protein n=1 Tax=Deinococcus indicus TaxID=223556 RepID=A0A246BIG2_9DEIO|nr:hypothetical protein [Deinococcus indicus]OWL95044.1 hypothetical protein CBQ26_13395 [Deinococcus indicus]